MINIDFEFDTKYGKYRDAIWLPEDHELSEVDIEQLKKQRLDNWINIIEAPKEAPIEAPIEAPKE